MGSFSEGTIFEGKNIIIRRKKIKEVIVIDSEGKISILFLNVEIHSDVQLQIVKSNTFSETNQHEFISSNFCFSPIF